MIDAHRIRATERPATGALVPLQTMPSDPGEHGFTDHNGTVRGRTSGGLVMVTSIDVVVPDGRIGAVGTCVVCGDAVPAGSGFAAWTGERGLRFGCRACRFRFEADPARYLAADLARSREADTEESPASEWACY